MRELNKFLEFTSDRKLKTLIVGETALACNSLVSGYNHWTVYTDEILMDKVPLGIITFEFYHCHDGKYLKEIYPNVYLPTPERAIIDTIIWQDENGTEGFLIEALQSYKEKGHKVSDLYECAEHYLVPHEVVDYWWKEALEDTDMSMG